MAVNVGNIAAKPVSSYRTPAVMSAINNKYLLRAVGGKYSLCQHSAVNCQTRERGPLTFKAGQFGGKSGTFQTNNGLNGKQGLS